MGVCPQAESERLGVAGIQRARGRPTFQHAVARRAALDVLNPAYTRAATVLDEARAMARKTYHATLKAGKPAR